MPYAASYLADPGYVSLTLSGSVTLEDLEGGRDRAVALLDKHRCRRLLVDATREQRKQPVLDDYSFTSQLGEQFPPGTVHAVVVRANEKEYMRFVENVAVNRGVDMQLFLDRDQALKWLVGRRPRLS